MRRDDANDNIYSNIRRNVPCQLFDARELEWRRVRRRRRGRAQSFLHGLVLCRRDVEGCAAALSVPSAASPRDPPVFSHYALSYVEPADRVCDNHFPTSDRGMSPSILWSACAFSLMRTWACGRCFLPSTVCQYRASGQASNAAHHACSHICRQWIKVHTACIFAYANMHMPLAELNTYMGPRSAKVNHSYWICVYANDTICITDNIRMHYTHPLKHSGRPQHVCKVCTPESSC